MPKKPYLVTVEDVRQNRGNSKRGPLTGIVMDRGFVQWCWTPAGHSGDPLSTRPHDQIVYVMDGEMQFDVDGEEYNLPAGSALYVPHTSVRTSHVLKGEPAHYMEIFGGLYWERWNFAEHQLSREPREWPSGA